ncbi:SRPBCC family protein [Microbacterium sp. KR10-403]|uniref:SRPBCC family protein n=1 Tax=Microbacterium sp. KR10-403 TaxID=3158581 RepID=UPI0032E4F9BD
MTGLRRSGYELDLGIHTIRGTGVSLGEKSQAGGARTSALLFDTDDRLSPLGAGRGYWRYVPHPEGVRFITGYDYEPGYGAIGRVLDRLLIRRIVWRMTAWSFDRLRLWAEGEAEPEQIRWWRFGGPRARARNCLSEPEGRSTRHVMTDAPEALTRIEDHD